MKVVDVSAALARASEVAADEASVVGLVDGPPGWELLVLGPGQRWAPDAGVARAILVLEGVATWRVDETRQSLASGHLLLVPRGAAVAAHNDGPAPMSALMQTRPGEDETNRA